MGLIEISNETLSNLIQHSTPSNFNAKANNSKKSMNSDEKRGVQRFQRIKNDSVELDPRLTNNSFEAKVSGVLKIYFFS